MSYAPNVVNKDDLIYLNGVTFKVKKDFNLIKGDKKLVLELDNRPKHHEYFAQVQQGT